jgi:hypothetical protein
MDGHAGYSAQRAQVELLAHRLVRVVRARTYQRGEVFDFNDGIFRQQKLAELAGIDPTVRGLPECAVVEVEAVDIDVGPNTYLPKMQKPPVRAASRPATEATGGIYQRYRGINLFGQHKARALFH